MVITIAASAKGNALADPQARVIDDGDVVLSHFGVRCASMLHLMPAALHINFNPLGALVPSWGEVAYRSSRPNPPRDGRGDLTNIARAIGEQENVALVRG
ncbi:hypothetical protein [Bradyrhizobium valentinum]|uniref:hypothetical protein n=1 Tax=Bradyrhizobium valentinum TaxID=1518501 RepID=UPI0012E35F4B|nr:hypothetical protein [Bradyrhizobium valentinum]